MPVPRSTVVSGIVSPSPAPTKIDRAGALLIHCARLAIGMGKGGDEWPSSIDWPYFMAQAEHHGLLPLVVEALAANGADVIPREHRHELRDRAFAIAAQNLSRSRVLGELVGLLESHGIPVLSFKGPALAVFAFGSVARRRFDDLDLLLEPEDVGRASALLIKNGYCAPDSELERTMRGNEMHVRFEHRASATPIELHWTLAPRRFGLRFPSRLLWNSNETLVVDGKTLRSVAPDVLLLMLCVHGARHEWRRLSWIVDVAAVVRRAPEIRWPRLQDEARRMGATRLVCLGLALARHLLGVTLPDDICRAIRVDRQCGLLRDQIVHSLFAWPPLPPDPWTRALFNWRSRERLTDRVRCLLGVLLEPTASDRRVVALPTSLSWLYYGLRPIRVAARWLTRTTEVGEATTALLR